MIRNEFRKKKLNYLQLEKIYLGIICEPNLLFNENNSIIIITFSFNLSNRIKFKI